MENVPDTLVQPIARPEELQPLLEAIHSTPEVYIDTEADSLHHYFEKVCLFQFTVGTNGSYATFLVDPLAKFDLKPLIDAMRDKLLVFHGADYDLKLLRDGYEFTPREIFDTMLAARLAGHSGLGLDALVQKYIGKELDHGAQKADWSQRPLPARLLKYAVEDTAHLPEITGKLRGELNALGRSEWHRQQCAQLVKLTAAPRERSEDDLWRIKGSFDLDRQSLAILRELWKWRDQEARDWDRPSFMVCNNDKLLKWTFWALDHGPDNLGAIPDIPPRWRRKRYDNLCAAFQRAWNVPPEEHPEKPARGKRPPFDPKFSPRLNRIKEIRNEKAKALALDPSILAANWMLEAIASRAPKTIDELNETERWLPWQTELMGKEFVAALAAT